MGNRHGCEVAHAGFNRTDGASSQSQQVAACYFIDKELYMSEHGQENQIHDVFLKSRDGAIVRCAAIMVQLKRNDLAKQILAATRIDRERFNELKAQNT